MGGKKDEGEREELVTGLVNFKGRKKGNLLFNIINFNQRNDLL